MKFPIFVAPMATSGDCVKLVMAKRGHPLTDSVFDSWITELSLKRRIWIPESVASGTAR